MVYYVGPTPTDSNFLSHHGIKGQKWGLRRFQNSDGSLTAEGKIRYGTYGVADASEKKQWRKTPAFERAHAGFEDAHLKNVSKNEKRLNNAKNSGASDKIIIKREQALKRAKLGLQYVQEYADRYYSAPRNIQQKASRNYDMAKVQSMIYGGLFGATVGVPIGVINGYLTELQNQGYVGMPSTRKWKKEHGW